MLHVTFRHSHITKNIENIDKNKPISYIIGAHHLLTHSRLPYLFIVRLASCLNITYILYIYCEICYMVYCYGRSLYSYMRAHLRYVFTNEYMC